MPRATQSKVTGILGFFRTTHIDAAELVYGQVQDLMRERRGRQSKAKKKAGTVPVTVANRTPAPSPAPPTAKAATPKKRTWKKKAAVVTPKKRKRRARRTPVNTPLPDVGADEQVLTPPDDQIEA